MKFDMRIAQIEFLGDPLEKGYDISTFPILQAGSEYRLIIAHYLENKYVGLEPFFSDIPEAIKIETMLKKFEDYVLSLKVLPPAFMPDPDSNAILIDNESFQISHGAGPGFVPITVKDRKGRHFSMFLKRGAP